MTTKEKTYNERLTTVIEIQSKLSELNLDDYKATKVLNIILLNYLNKGIICNTELEFNNVMDTPRKYIINLYNNSFKRDQVYIKTL